MHRLRSLDLFSGIGGFALGFERAGLETAAFCEIDPKCRAVLAAHWPDVPRYEDVRTLPLDELGAIDVVCGGFPCQDLSHAGHMKGLDAEKSGLWWEMLRIAGELRPQYLVVENVVNLMSSRKPWFGTFLRSLAEIGFDAEWSCIPAAYAGASHIRDRVFVVAYPYSRGRSHSVFVQPSFSISECVERPPDGALARALDCRLLAPREFEADNRFDGLSAAVDGVAQLGNSVMPQIVQAIGEAIVRDAA